MCCVQDFMVKFFCAFFTKIKQGSLSSIYSPHVMILLLSKNAIYFSLFQKILSGSLQSLLASKEPEILVKAKSEVSLACTTSQSLSVELSTATLGGGSTTASTAQVHHPRPQESSPKPQIIPDSICEPATIGM